MAVSYPAAGIGRVRNHCGAPRRLKTRSRASRAAVGVRVAPVPPGRASVRRCAVSRNRPLAALAPGGQRSFPRTRARRGLGDCWPLRKTDGAARLGPRENILPAPGRPVGAGPVPKRRLAARTAGRHPPPGRVHRLRKDSPMTTSTSSAAPAGARNASLEDLAALLRDQQARKIVIRHDRTPWAGQQSTARVRRRLPAAVRGSRQHHGRGHAKQLRAPRDGSA